MTAFAAFAKACGAESVREATEDDAVGGVVPACVVAARDTGSIAEAMTATAEHGLSVVARGSGTKLDWGNPPSKLDVLFDMTPMNSVVEHAAGDLIVRVQPGVRLAALQQVLAASNQRLSVDEMVPGSTIGGIVATGLSGPSRLLYGAVRDLLIGITVVRADGVVARSGGKVVKNVAGYDLGKLYTGSYGTLGIITEATFRLHPVPEAAVYVTKVFADEGAAATCIAAVLGSQLAPSAIEIERPDAGAALTVGVLVEGSKPGAGARVEQLAVLLGGDVTSSSDRPAWWGSLPGAATIRLTSQLAGVPRVLRAVADASGDTGIPLSVRGSAGTGVLYAGFSADVDPVAAAQLLEKLRTACAAEDGFAVLLRAPAAIKNTVDAWGMVPGLSLMRKVKENFDPEGRLAPGRFVGGI